MFADLLKTHTREEHLALERSLIGSIKAVRSVADYTQLLALLYGFYAPLEAALQPYLADTDIPLLEKRRKAGDLLHDLRASGHAGVPALCSDLPVVSSYAHALGVLYVLEGSTLGGQIIAGMLRKQMGADAALTFFTSYGDDTTAMWQSFKDYLNTTLPGDQPAALAAATDTFITFKNWVLQHEPATQL